MSLGRSIFTVALALFSVVAMASNEQYLVKVKQMSRVSVMDTLGDGEFSLVSEAGKLFKWAGSTRSLAALKNHPNVEFVQKNHPIRLFSNPSIEKNREALLEAIRDGGMPGFGAPPAADNPEIKAAPVQLTGADPLLGNAWGFLDINAKNAWNNTPKGAGIIVAVTDTGIDYNHEDLAANMWRNSKEVPGDGIDNDNNGFVDDVVGWDFAANDNKPYDLTVGLMEILTGGGNPGHGTHCSGVVGARGDNGKGISGTAPAVSLMGLRFINEKGQGDTAAAVQVVDYAVKNGAHIISASWGGEGEELGDNALREAVMRARDEGVLFIVAAGNGRNGVGYNNDTDSKPVFPASYEYENMITVAAIDSADKLAGFSNFGKVGVDIGAPGVKILSTVPGDQYQDTVIDLGELLHATWDGTSMATPFVAGALADVWSADPGMDALKVRQEILDNAKKTSALSGKVSTDGKLNLSFLTR